MTAQQACITVKDVGCADAKQQHAVHCLQRSQAPVALQYQSPDARRVMIESSE